MKKKKSTADKPFWLFMVAALAAGVIYLLWGQRNTAMTLYELGFLRYRAEEQMEQVEPWAIPIPDAADYKSAVTEAEEWASEQETASGSYVTATAAARFGEGAELSLGYTLYGPETGKTVILLHGYCESDSDSLLWASFWQEQGYRVLIPVQRGYVDPEETNYVPTTFGVYESCDLHDLILTLGLDTETVLLHGRGAGAAAAVLLAADEELWNAGVDGIVAESVYDNLGQTERALVKSLFRLGDNFVGRFLREIAEKRLGFAPDEVDLCGAAKRMKTPVLFLCASEDEFLGAARTEAVSAACASEKTLRHLQGAYRTLWLRDGDNYRAAISEFLR